MKSVGVIILVGFLFFTFNPYDYFIGGRNIEKCMTLVEGITKNDVLNIMGKPNNIFDNGKTMQYHPTKPLSSCQIVLKFKEIESGNLVLESKFCDDGKIYKCRG